MHGGPSVMCPLCDVSCRASECVAMLTEIVITEQPVCACVPTNFPLTLRCRAQSPLPLHYQWFEQQESTCKEIPDANQPNLHIVAKQTQLYICRVNDQRHRILFSRWVKVKVVKSFAKIPPGWKGDPIIVTEPVSSHVASQHPVQFQCCALGIPAPQYQWYHNGQCLPHRKGRKLLIKVVKPGHCGSYLCCVSNDQGECWSEPVELTIGEDVILQASPKPLTITGKVPTDEYFAVGKVALLIGNNGYLNHPNLLAPMVDVYELSVLLRKIGFCVVSLVDLTHEEMLRAVNQFLQLLDRGVYGLFYYAGHGYEHSGRNYMVPIDAPQPYRPENCISVQKILQKMQDRRTALNVVLLDTCRKWYNSDCALSKVNPLKPWGNTVYGYATSENAEAYEVQDGEFCSGIFMTYLKKHIMEEKKVTHMLEEVLEDIGRDPLVTGKQVMEIRHSLKEPRALTDKICTTGYECPNKTEWEQHIELPKQKIKFSCGAEVELTYQTVFSNLIHTFATLTHSPPHLTNIRIILYKPYEMAKLCRLDRVDSVLTTGSDLKEADSMIRLHGLQKFQDIIIKVDLHCTNIGTGNRIQESWDQRVPKLWISKLFSRKDVAFLDRDHAAGATYNDYVPANGSQLTTDCNKHKPGAHHPENPSALPSSIQSKSNSEPEENDESDIFLVS
ncbi:mucosa-associated lymphoid tissue lymphoma translocation protein 1-like isoform X2 [Spea bombifrons]|uniref:mucosa-associated lymphoid tissue lymphoma translocation protein 1-like isoform X2 n=1 Tax=Spea bombifrons TaxID=233779 RepID=UPI002349AE8B|nr:mucosa-associated lymphoid tissue lymphoma translocation protein 1-like isoform X2 [Spea bombifrons]